VTVTVTVTVPVTVIVIVTVTQTDCDCDCDCDMQGDCQVTDTTACCREWQHAESWWPRLLRHHEATRWDDYDKDYSDLPDPLLQLHFQQQQHQQWLQSCGGQDAGHMLM
jgi:hypothetical protein